MVIVISDGINNTDVVAFIVRGGVSRAGPIEEILAVASEDEKIVVWEPSLRFVEKKAEPLPRIS